MPNRFGQQDKAINIDGIVLEANIPNLPIGGGARTIALWMRHTGPNYSALFSYGQSGNGQLFSMFINGQDRLQFFGGGAGYDYIYYDPILTTNTWYHVTITSFGGNIKLYVNGQYKDNYMRSLNTANSTFSLGVFRGDMDDLRIYDRVLSDAEIQCLATGAFPTFSSLPFYCSGSTIPDLPTVSINGYSGTWVPPINNTQTTLYSFIANQGECVASSVTTTIKILENNIAPTFNLSDTICSGTTLPASSLEGIPGTWSPSTLQPGTSTYTFTPNSQYCGAQIFTKTMVLKQSKTSAFSIASGFCANSDNQLYTVSDNGISGMWTPAWNPNVSQTYTFTPNEACASTVVLPITINPNFNTPASPYMIPANSGLLTICEGNATTIPVVSSTGATVKWFTSMSDATPIFEGNTLTTPVLNDTTTYYAFAQQGFCISPRVPFTVKVKPTAPTPNFSQIAPICQGGSLSLSTVSPNGITGSWSPTANNNATTTYTFTPQPAECSTPQTMTIVVNPNIAPTFNQVASICVGETLAPLPTTSMNGFSGTWAPPVNNMATTTYTFTPIPATGQCVSTATMTVMVNSPATPTFTQVPAICPDDTFTLPTTSTNGIAGTWSPAINNTATTTYTFTPNTGECAIGTASMQIVVNPLETSTFTQVNSICQGDALAALPTTSNNGITDFWTPAVNNNATTTYTFIPASGFCTTGNQTMTIVVNPTAQTNLDTLVCHGEVFTFGTHTISSNGVYSKLLQTVAGCDSTVSLTVNYRLPITNTLTVQRCIGETYTFDGQSITTDGTHTAVFTSAAGCDSTVTLNITFVNSITASISASICSGDSYLLGTQELTATGVYSETFQSVVGCDSIVNLTLTVNPLPTVNITYSNGILEATTGFATYQWYKDGVQVNGATGATYTPTELGAYHVEVSDAAGCTATSLVENVTTLSVKDLLADRMIVYPNPTSAVLNISLQQAANIEIVDVIGQKVQSHQLQAGLNTIDVSELVTGVYFIQTTDGSAIKFVVAK